MDILPFIGKQLVTQEKRYLLFFNFSTTVTHGAYKTFELMTEFMFI